MLRHRGVSSFPLFLRLPRLHHSTIPLFLFMNTQRFFQRLTLLFFAGLVFGISAYAQGNEGSEERSFFTIFTDTFDGYIENATAVRLDELDRFTKITNSLRLKYEHDFGDHVTLKLDGLGVYDAVYDVEDLDVEDEDEYHAYADLREGVLNFGFDKFDLRLGRQQYVWEVTDRLQVLDVVNPLDLKEFILEDFEDLRIPLWGMNFSYYFTFDYSLQALVIPDMTFTKLANAGSEFEYHQDYSAFSEAGFSHFIVNEEDDPDVNFENTTYGLRFKGFHDGWDFTLNYLYGWNNSPTRRVQVDLDTGTVTTSLGHDRMHLIGASVVNVLWDTVVRLEIAAKLGMYFNIADLQVSDMVVEKDRLDYAIALERDLYDITWLAQFVQRSILDYEDAISTDQHETMATLRATKALNDEETIELELLGMYNFSADDYLFRPSIEYAITDAWRFTSGLDIFGGGDEYSFLGQFDDQDRLYAEIRYSF